jgi:hypothetical protein
MFSCVAKKAREGKTENWVSQTFSEIASFRWKKGLAKKP